jgi:hypothetical protein
LEGLGQLPLALEPHIAEQILRALGELAQELIHPAAQARPVSNGLSGHHYFGEMGIRPK